MIIEKQQDGLFFTFENLDWVHADAKGLIGFIKETIPASDRSYDDETKQWWISGKYTQPFYHAKQEFIDAKIHKNQIAMEL